MVTRQPTLRELLKRIHDTNNNQPDHEDACGCKSCWSRRDAKTALQILNESKRGWFHDGVTPGGEESAYREVFDPGHLGPEE
jgi:hypothetical protein